MKNEELKSLIKSSGIKLWEVAYKLNMSDGNFSRKLRREFSPDEKRKILSIINDLKEEKNHE
jgi:hypothetical protein